MLLRNSESDKLLDADAMMKLLANNMCFRQRFTTNGTPINQSIKKF